MPAHLSPLRPLALLTLALLTAGCSATYVTFDGPANSILWVNDKPYHLPSQVELWRPGFPGDANRYNVALVFNTPAGETRANGFMDVYGYTESDVDRLVTNTCKFQDDQLANLAAGQTTVYKLKTASRQPLLDLTLLKK